jgi:hypothetical protein
MKTKLQIIIFALFTMALTSIQTFGQDVSRIDVSSFDEMKQQIQPDLKISSSGPMLGRDYVAPPPTTGTVRSSLPFEGFEGTTFPPTGWDTTIVSGSTTQRWIRSTTTTGYGMSNGSAQYNFFSSTAGDRQYLQTPTFAATGVGEVLQFDAGWTSYTGLERDSLIIQVSSDGVNFSDLVIYFTDTAAYNIPAANFLMTGPRTTASANVQDGYWVTKQIPLPVGTIAIRFLAISAFGNSLYLDNIQTFFPAAPGSPMPGGNYTINPSLPPSVTNYQSFTTAAADLSSRGISGPITFNVSSGIYAERFIIFPIAGTSSTNTVTFQPSGTDGIGVVISASNSTTTNSTTDYAVLLLGCDWVTFNNIDVVDAGTTTATKINRGYSIGSYSGTDGSRNCRIINCSIRLGGLNGTVGVEPVSIGIVAAGFIQGMFSGTIDSTTISGNTIDACDRGIGFFGTLTVATAGIPWPVTKNQTVTNNILGSTLSLGNNVTTGGPIGIIIQGTHNAICTGNLLDSMKITNATATTSMTGMTAQIASGIFANNRIEYMSHANLASATPIMIGFQAGAVTDGTGTFVYNNTISGMTRAFTGTATATICMFGLQATNFVTLGTPGSFIYMANNSVYLNNPLVNYSSVGYRVNVTGLTTYCYNNLLYNNNSANASATPFHAAIADANAGRTFLNSNYNNLIAPGANGVVGRYSTTNAATLALWKTGGGANIVGDTNSVNGVPVFSSAVTLAPDVTNSANWVLNGNGTPLGFVATDILGNVRSTTIAGGATDIGAYEFTMGTSAPTIIIPVAGTGNYALNSFGNNIGNINITNVGSLDDAPITQLDVQYVSGSNPPGSNPIYHYANGYWVVTPNGGASGYSYNMTLKYSQGMLGTIASESGIRMCKSDNAGVSYTPYLTSGTNPGEYQLDIANDSITVFGLTSLSHFGLTDDVAPLPVELASFTSSTNRNGVILNWATVSEINNAGFDIERKSVSSETWNKVGNVVGNGTTNEIRNYTYSDNGLQTGKYNYRLKQIDFNGNFQYFNLSNEVIVGVPEKYDISQNYPNPFNPATKINYDIPFDGKVSIAIYDMTGREVAKLVNEIQPAGYYTIQFNASKMTSGVYFYRIISEGNAGQQFVMTKKMVLVK